MNVILIGYRGSGKTEIGKIIAKRLQRKFVDIDDVIVETAGKSIPKIFREDGEPRFRELETECIKKICRRGDLVIAFGGGAVENPENIRVAKRSGAIVLLIASPETIWERIKGDKNRPRLTKKKNRFDEIRAMIKKRKSAYESAADFVVRNEGKTIVATVAEIEGFLKRKGIVRPQRRIALPRPLARKRAVPRIKFGRRK